MFITVHLVDGRKITKSPDRLVFFSGWDFPSGSDIEEGTIYINSDSVVDMRVAEEDEVRHAEIHGY